MCATSNHRGSGRSYKHWELNTETFKNSFLSSLQHRHEFKSFRLNTETRKTNSAEQKQPIKCLSKYKKEFHNDLQRFWSPSARLCTKPWNSHMIKIGPSEKQLERPVATPTAPSQCVQLARKVSDHRLDVFLRNSLLSPTSDLNAFLSKQIRADQNANIISAHRRCTDMANPMWFY